MLLQYRTMAPPKIPSGHFVLQAALGRRTSVRLHHMPYCDIMKPLHRSTPRSPGNYCEFNPNQVPSPKGESYPKTTRLGNRTTQGCYRIPLFAPACRPEMRTLVLAWHRACQTNARCTLRGCSLKPLCTATYHPIHKQLNNQRKRNTKHTSSKLSDTSFKESTCQAFVFRQLQELESKQPRKQQSPP